MTIVEPIIRVLKDEGRPLSHLMIYKLINERYYYDFGLKIQNLLLEEKSEDIAKGGIRHRKS